MNNKIGALLACCGGLLISANAEFITNGNFELDGHTGEGLASFTGWTGTEAGGQLRYDTVETEGVMPGAPNTLIRLKGNVSIYQAISASWVESDTLTLSFNACEVSWKNTVAGNGVWVSLENPTDQTEYYSVYVDLDGTHEGISYATWATNQTFSFEVSGWDLVRQGAVAGQDLTVNLTSNDDASSINWVDNVSLTARSLPAPDIWFDAAEGLGLVDEHVAVWTNLASPGVFDAVQTDASKRPELMHESFPGHQVVGFDGSDDILTVENTAGDARFEGELTVFYIGRTLDGGSFNGSGGFLGNFQTGNSYKNGWSLNTSSVGTHNALLGNGSWNNVSGGTTELGDDFVMLNSRYSDAGDGTGALEMFSSLAYDSTTVATSPFTPSPSSADISIGMFSSYNSLAFNRAVECDVVEVRIYGRALSDAEREAVWDDLSAKYAITKNKDIVVSNTMKQELRFGIDAERLWYWRTGLANELAQAAIVEIQSDYVRVAVNCAYEREEGVKDVSAYDKILNMMTAMKTAKPDIKFFASPRPLSSAYSSQEEIDLWGGKVPWAPYPAWIMTWIENGTTTEGITKWKQGTLHIDKLTQYYADYLNFMAERGFVIHYLDITNEKSITPDQMETVVTDMPALLDPGVSMPLMIAPSAWSHEQGTAWINSAANPNIFDVVASHNTGKAGSPEAFAEAAAALGKEAWNSELHGWMGIELEDEILNSSYLWEHMRGGFTGIDSWLFFGPLNGKDHTMLWSNSSTIIRSGKYEIFKKLVNNSNRGNYVDIEMISDQLITTAFQKDDVLTVWALNKSSNVYEDIEFVFPERDLNHSLVEVTHWHSSLDRAGKVTMLEVWEEDRLSVDLESLSLYCFKIDLVAPVADNMTVVVNETNATDIILTGADAYGDPLTYKVISQPTHGRLDGVAPNLTYTADAGFNEEDSFTFTVNDGTRESAEATVTILDVNQLQIISLAGSGNGYDVSAEEAAAFRSTGTAKAFDADEDDVYGTAGTFFYGNGVDKTSNSDGTPSWVTAVGSLGVTLAANAVYAGFDNPTLSISNAVADWAATAIGLVNPEGTTGGIWSELMTFTVDTTAPRNFRLGVMAGNEWNTDGRWDPAGLRLSFEGGPSAIVSGLGAIELGMVFFDVTLPDAVFGTFSIEGQNRDVGGNTKGASIAGITFDVVHDHSYVLWTKHAFADGPQGTDQTNSGNPDGDRFNNRLEWALAMDPLVVDEPVLAPNVSNETFVVTYARRDAEATGVDVYASWATSLTSTVWRVHGDGMNEKSKGWSNEVETVLVELPLDHTNAFIRIQAEER